MMALLFPSPCGDEYNLTPAPEVELTVGFRPLAGMSIITDKRFQVVHVSKFPSPCGDEYNLPFDKSF